MNSSQHSPDKVFSKRSLIEWSVIGAVIAVLYLTGLHTNVLGTLQRAMLWTGLFDADTSKITTINGPHLDNRDFNLALQSSDGTQATLGDFKNQVLFVNVWASWCPPCIAEMPTIETLYKAVGNHSKIKFILLSMDQNREQAINFMDGKGFSMPYYFPRSRMPDKLQSTYLPTTYVISKEGRIAYKKEGIADYSSPNFAHWMRELADK